MSTLNGGPNIISDNLLLYLDAANIKSFVSGSTAWNDLSKNNLNGTLINGPAYDSANAGNITFDGTNDYCIVNNNSLFSTITNKLTIEVFVYFNTNGFSNQIFLNKENSFRLIGFDVSSIRLGARYATNTTIWGNGTVTGATLLTAGWHHCVLSYDGSFMKLYLDGKEDGSRAESGNISYTTNELSIGSFSYLGFLQHCFNGKGSIVRIYNRGLTSNEVVQNFNASKGRYGL